MTFNERVGKKMQKLFPEKRNIFVHLGTHVLTAKITILT